MIDANEFRQLDNLLKEVAGGLPYEAAKEELEALCENYNLNCQYCKKCGENTCIDKYPECFE